MPAPDLPSYHELPVAPGAPAGSSWGLWGDRDVLGCLNLIDQAAVRRGLAAATSGRVHSLSLELEVPDPPLFGRPRHRHDVHASEWSADDSLSGWNTQSSSQWDSFRHIRSPVHGAYGGIPEDEHGIHHWARRGIVTRGVLADLARWRETVDRPVAHGTPEDLPFADVLSTLEAQGTAVEPGDLLLIRTGWTAWYRNLDRAERERYVADGNPVPGLEASEASARGLWDLHVAAVAADNPSLEAWPSPMQGDRAWRSADLSDPAVAAGQFLHLSLLPLLGLPVGELFDLDALADDCASTGTWTFLFTSAPLNLAHGVASPANALAVC